MNKTNFDIINSTGKKQLILKYKKDCSCKKNKEFVNSPSDYSTIEGIEAILDKSYNKFLNSFGNLSGSKISYCDKCFQIGSFYSVVITEPVRIDINSTPYSTAGNILDYKFIPIDNKSYCVFLPSKYENITDLDLFCMFNDDEKTIKSVFRILGKEKFSYDNFSYYKVVISNILNSKLVGTEVKDYVLRTSK